MTDLDIRPPPPSDSGVPAEDAAPAVTRFGTGNEGYATLVWRRFRRSTMGMIGLETALGIVQKTMVDTGLLTWRDVARVMSEAPARIGRDVGHGAALEPGFDPRVVEALQQRGHEVTIEPGDGVFAFGGAQLVKRLAGNVYVGGSDPRKDGQVVAV